MRKKIWLITITLLIISLLFLTGCSAFPKTAEELLDDTKTVWQNDVSSITDTIKITNFDISVPIKISSSSTKNFGFNLTKGLITIKRSLIDEELNIQIDAQDIGCDITPGAAEFLPDYHFDKLDTVKSNMVMRFLPDKLVSNMVITGMNAVHSEYEPTITRQTEFADSSYGNIYKSIIDYSYQSIFGTIQPDGKLDKDTSSYQYTLPSKKVHDELLRLPKILIDTLGGYTIDGTTSSVQGVLTKYFDTYNIVNIADSILTPQDMKVICTTAKSGKHYYIDKITANYISSGSMSQVIADKLLTDFLNSVEGGADQIGSIELSGRVQISSKMTITSVVNLKQ